MYVYYSEIFIIVILALLNGSFGELCGYYSSSLTQYKYRYCSGGCCGSNTYQYCCPETNWTAVTVGAIIGGLIVIAIIVILVICCIQKNKINRNKHQVKTTFKRFRPPQYQGKLSPKMDFQVTYETKPAHNIY